MQESVKFKPVQCHAYVTNHLKVATEGLIKNLNKKIEVEVDFGTFTNTKDDIISTTVKCNGESLFFHRDHLHIVGGFNEKKDCIIVDIDGVITFFDKVKKGTLMDDGTITQWTDISDSMNAKVSYVVDLIKGLKSNLGSSLKVIFLTARGESQRVVTEALLDKHFKSYTLFMRGFNDNSSDCGSLKVQMIQTCIEPYFNVKLFIEDTEETVKLCNNILPHIKTLLVNNGDNFHG